MYSSYKIENSKGQQPQSIRESVSTSYPAPHNEAPKYGTERAYSRPAAIPSPALGALSYPPPLEWPESRSSTLMNVAAATYPAPVNSFQTSSQSVHSLRSEHAISGSPELRDHDILDSGDPSDQLIPRLERMTWGLYNQKITYVIEHPALAAEQDYALLNKFDSGARLFRETVLAHLDGDNFREQWSEQRIFEAGVFARNFQFVSGLENENTLGNRVTGQNKKHCSVKAMGVAEREVDIFKQDLFLLIGAAKAFADKKVVVCAFTGGDVLTAPEFMFIETSDSQEALEFIDQAMGCAHLEGAVSEGDMIRAVDSQLVYQEPKALWFATDGADDAKERGDLKAALKSHFESQPESPVTFLNCGNTSKFGFGGRGMKHLLKVDEKFGTLVATVGPMSAEKHAASISTGADRAVRVLLATRDGKLNAENDGVQYATKTDVAKKAIKSALGVAGKLGKVAKVAAIL